MQFLHAGDELVVLRLDRLGRSTRGVLNLVHELDEKGRPSAFLSPKSRQPEAWAGWSLLSSDGRRHGTQVHQRQAKSGHRRGKS
ncbi:recombinase family protein [Rhizobium leguminosarum]|uniref:recombinase family protein n=1 Tax=Rhizobium leguminosarum TaxID=384 RepID=UPI0032AFA6E8